MSAITFNQASTWYTPKLSTTKRRHQIVIDMVNDLMRVRVKGMRPNYDDVLEQVSLQTGYSTGTIANIISRNKKG